MIVLSLEEALKCNAKSFFEDPVVIPTETVYGLSARIDNEEALNKIFEIKGRPKDNPLILHVSSYEMLNTIVEGDIPAEYQILMKKFWPGPLTLIFKSKSSIPQVIRGSSLDTIAVRMPKNNQLRSLIDILGVPLAAPSANSSGRPSPTRIDHVINDFGEKVKYYIDDGPCTFGLESTVFGKINNQLILLRPGFVTKEDIENTLGCQIQVQTKVNLSEKTVCPGQKYRHYSPSIPLVLFKGREWASKMKQESFKYLNKKIGVMCISDIELDFSYFCKLNSPKNIKEYGSNIFSSLIELDNNCDIIFAQGVETNNEGLAIMDRLEKASSMIIY